MLSAKLAVDKVISAAEAVAKVKSGDLLLSGGFGICGNPNYLLRSLSERATSVESLTVVSNNTGLDEYGIGHLIKKGMVKRCISSYLGNNKTFYKKYLAGEVELEITPQGTIAEKIKSGGKGIAAFWTPTGVGTLVEHGGFPIKYKLGSKEVDIYSQTKPTGIFNGKLPSIRQKVYFGKYVVWRRGIYQSTSGRSKRQFEISEGSEKL